MERDLATAWLRNVPALRATDLRVKLVESELVGGEIDVVARALETIAGRAEQADPLAREVLAAAAPTLTAPAHSALVDALREHAEYAGMLALSRLLRRRASQVALEQQPAAERHPAAMPAGRHFTLGERRSLARGRDRALLDRLLRDPHPLVIRIVLSNPRITEDDIVRLAARRPTFPDVQAELARSSRWSARPRVRLALVQNPFTPPSIAVPLVALLIRPELEQVVGATDLPAVVRGAARELLDRRPPVPRAEDDEPPTIN